MPTQAARTSITHTVTFDLLTSGQYMSRACRWLYLYRLWCWLLKSFSFHSAGKRDTCKGNWNSPAAWWWNLTRTPHYTHELRIEMHNISGPTLWQCLPPNIRKSQTITHLSDIINCFLLEMLHISGTAISVIACNCMSFVTSFIMYFSETLIFW